MSALRWNCKKAGCLVQRRTDPVILDGCFPGGISASDLDAVVELSGQLLVMEFKRDAHRVPDGQLRMLRTLAGMGATVVVVDALEQHVRGWREVTADGLGEFKSGDTERLRAKVHGWARRVAPSRAAPIGPTRRPAA